MGMAFDVGCGRKDINIIEEMLNNPKLPETTNRNVHFKMADPKGLHLADVIYPDDELDDSTDNFNFLPIGDPTEYPSPTIEWLVDNRNFRAFLDGGSKILNFSGPNYG